MRVALRRLREDRADSGKDVEPDAMLTLTTRELGRIATEAVAHRDARGRASPVDRGLRRRAAQRSLPRRRRRGLELRRRRSTPRPTDHFVEIDLIVPELAEADPASQKQPWFPLVGAADAHGCTCGSAASARS